MVTKLTSILSAFALLSILIGCKDESTIYNGFIMNSTGNIIAFEIKGDNNLEDTISIPAGSKQKVYENTENGDFEIFDCSLIFDTIKYTFLNQDYTLISDTAIILSSSELSSDGTRVHDCTVDIR